MSSDLPDDQLPPQPLASQDDPAVPPTPESIKAPMAPTPPPVASFALLDEDLPPTPPDIAQPLPMPSLEMPVPPKLESTPEEVVLDEDTDEGGS